MTEIKHVFGKLNPPPKGVIMNQEILNTPWSHDELQLIGAELADTVDLCNENNDMQSGVIVFLTKQSVFVLTQENNILKFGRTSLTSFDHKWDIIGLSQKEIKLSKEQWEYVKKRINLTKKRKEKNESIFKRRD